MLSPRFVIGTLFVIPLLAQSQSTPRGPAIPSLLHWCSAHCSTWTLDKGAPFDKPHYGSQALGAIVIVERWTRESVVMNRTDYNVPGKAVLTGKLSSDGNSIVNGTIEWTYHPCCGLGTGKFQAAWGPALDTVPGTDEEREARQTAALKDRQNAPPQNSGLLASTMPKPPVSAAPQTASAGAENQRPRIPHGKLNLAGKWQVVQITPDKTRHVVGVFQIQQDGDDIKIFQDDNLTGWKGICTFEGHLNGLAIEGRGRDPKSTPQNPRSGPAGRILIDDPDHTRTEVDNVPFMRVTVGPDDVPCDAENSSRTTPWYAHKRAQLAIVQQKDYSKAACWFRVSAIQGDAGSQGQLAYLLYDGKGVGRDYKESFAWAQKSAAQQDMFGELVLSTLYKEGKGVAPDPEKAAYWSRQVAAQKSNRMWSRLNEKTPSGLTPLQAIGLAFGTFLAVDADIAHEENCGWRPAGSGGYSVCK